MSITVIVFGLFAAITVLSGTFLALTRNLLHAAFSLFAVLFGVAGLYVFAQAEFLAVTQVIVYVGGILVILLFGIMLTDKLRELRPGTGLVNFFPGVVLATAMFFALALMIREFPLPTASPQGIGDDVHAIGQATLTAYLLPFELVSILLLSVLIGAAYLTRREKTNTAGGDA